MDATAGLRAAAAACRDAEESTSCNQSAYKVRGKAYLYVGPGAKGVGHKAMFKLGESMAEAEGLASSEPARFEVGNTGWVTARFSDEEPLPGDLWERWLAESYGLSS